MKYTQTVHNAETGETEVIEKEYTDEEAQANLNATIKAGLIDELCDIESWFTKYDEKNSQHAREVRLGSVSFDITEWDKEAETKRKRSNAIKKLLENL